MVYTGEDGPPTTDEEMKKCSTTIIEFEYRFLNGKNSGFYFSIPSNAAGNIDSIVAQGREIQIGSIQMEQEARDRIDSMGHKLMYPQTQEATEQIVRTTLKTQFQAPGSTYDFNQRDALANVNAHWNSVRLELGPLGNNGMEVSVYINNSRVNNYLDTEKKSHGKIAIQAHDKAGDVVFKDLRWSKK